jgi:O-glycosyl hydrolase
MLVPEARGAFLPAGVVLILFLAAALSGRLDRLNATVEATLVVDANQVRQTIVGFGGDMGPDVVADLMAIPRKDLLAFAFGEMRLNVVRMGHLPYEGATAENFWGANDNADPFMIDWSRFNFCTQPGRLCNDDWKTLLPEIRALEVDGEYFGNIQGPRWNGFDGASALNEDEMVENQLALFLHYRDRLGMSVTWVAPFSEPGGGGINWRISPAQAASVVAKLGARLEVSGFRGVRMLVPDAISVESSAGYARAILAEPLARRYVGALGYHTYITKDGGPEPDSRWIRPRQQILGLAAAHGLPVRMTEYCCLAGLMQRTNHIYNELEYADSQTYAPQWIMRRTGSDGHGGRVTETDRESILFYTSQGRGEAVRFGPTRHTGVAIGHYSKYARPGSVRLAASTAGAGLRVQAFHARREAELGMVIINNGEAPRDVTVRVRGGLRLAGLVRGELTTERGSGYWLPVLGFQLMDQTTFKLTAPARSVTSVALRLAN